MKQALHIFAKDVRVFWIEILAVLAVMASIGWIYCSEWAEWLHRDPGEYWISNPVAVLIPVSWLVLIVRVIHAEKLVGEREFWITRPYRWPSLIGAKALFVATFVCLPSFVGMCLLLHMAGMHPFAYVPGMMFNLMMITGIYVLPAACLAAVTRSFPRVLLALLCLFLFAAGAVYLNDLLPLSSPPDTVGHRFAFLGSVFVFLGVLIIQYARHTTVLSRYLLAAVPVLLVVLFLFGPEEIGMALSYPINHQESNPALALDPIKFDFSDSNGWGDGRQLTIGFPIKVTGLAPGTALSVDAARVTLTGEGGEHWTSHWQEAGWILLPEQTGGVVSMRVNTPFNNRVKDKPVSVEMSLALTTLKAGPATQMDLPNGMFTLPGGSVCKISGRLEQVIACLSPMRQPPLMRLTTRFTFDDCAAGPPSGNGVRGAAWVGTADQEPAEFGLTPVVETLVNFQVPPEHPSDHEHLCPGSPLFLEPYAVVSKMQRKITGQLPGLRGSKAIPQN